MVCNDCSAAAQIPSPFSSKAVAQAITPVLAMVVGAAIMLLPFAVAALIAAPFVAAGYWFLDVTTLRAVIRRNAVGVPLFAFHECGMPHEHLAPPARGTPCLRLRIGGWFRRFAILGPVTAWRIVRCWDGLRTPVTIRNRVTGDTLTSSAPFRLLERVGVLHAARHEATAKATEAKVPKRTPADATRAEPTPAMAPAAA